MEDMDNNTLAVLDAESARQIICSRPSRVERIQKITDNVL